MMWLSAGAAAGLLTAAKKTRRSSLHSIAPTGAILINALTLGGWYLLPGLAVAISCATGIYAFLFSCLSRREGERCEIGVARIECSRLNDRSTAKSTETTANDRLLHFMAHLLRSKNSASLE